MRAGRVRAGIDLNVNLAEWAPCPRHCGRCGPAGTGSTARRAPAVRFAPLIAASPADRPLIMGHLVRLYLQTLGIEPEPSAEEMS